MSVEMIVFVTKQLGNELAATGRVLAAADKDAATPRKGVNDKTHYTEVTEQLEALTVAVLGAASAQPFIGMATVTGARFDLGASTVLAHHVSATVGYLRNTATPLVAAGEFSLYQSDNAGVALAMLRKLSGLVLSGIVKQAEGDLVAVRGKGASTLVAAADRLAKLAASEQPGPAAEDGYQVFAQGKPRGLVAKLADLEAGRKP